MNKARNLILELYRKGTITKKETNILIDSMQPACVNSFSNWGVADWTYRPYEQPIWTITSTNADI